MTTGTGTAVVFTVFGTPAPQGSKRSLGRGVMVESSTKVAPWRADVRQAAMSAYSGPPLAGPLTVTAVFTLPKPKSAPKRRRTWPDKKPDLDKLVRSTLDAICSAGTWADDAQVVHLDARKLYAGDPGALHRPGARIEIGTPADVTRHGSLAALLARPGTANGKYAKTNGDLT